MTDASPISSSAALESAPVDAIGLRLVAAGKVTPADVEKALGRDKKGDWGPRTIDLDLILHGDEVVNDEDLVIPHPRMHERKFVLEPLVALDPGLTHPVFGKTVAQLLAELK